MKKVASWVLSLTLLAALVWVISWLAGHIWGQFKLLDPQISIGILTAATTVIVATLTVVLGKYYERMKDIEAHYRVKKTEIYDEFLCEFFKLFHSNGSEDYDLVPFLRGWQRKMILWGGQEVLSKYIVWMTHLKKGVPNARTMFLIEDFFLEIRKDLGHKNNKLTKGTFVHLILQNPELFLAMENNNPNITLAELAEAESALQR